MGNYTRTYYHCETPQWRRSTGLSGQYVGIEFECEARASTSYHDLLAALPDFRRNKPITESDGSLSVGRGLEIVFPPVKYASLTNKNSVFARSIKSLEGKIANARGAGMHVNINTRDWSASKRLLFVALFNHIEPSLLALKGGRTLTSYCRQIRCSTLANYDGLDSHRYAAEVKQSRVELRFPKSTTNMRKIKGLMKFIQSVEDFAEMYQHKYRYNSSTRDIPNNYKEFLLGSRKYAALYREFYGKKPRTNKATKQAKRVSKDATQGSLFVEAVTACPA